MQYFVKNKNQWSDYFAEKIKTRTVQLVSLTQDGEIILREVDYLQAIFLFLGEYMSFYQLGRLRLPFDPTIYNSIYDYGYIIQNTTSITMRNSIAKMFFLMFNGVRRFNDIVWEIDDIFSQQSGEVAREKLNKIQIFTLCCCGLTFLIFIVQLPVLLNFQNEE